MASVIFSRPLPIANLNDAAGANRSNIAWQSGYTSGSNYYIVGDDFKVDSIMTIDTLTVWLVANNPLASGLSAPQDEFAEIRLYGGPERNITANH